MHQTRRMRVGIAHHLGWAVAVTASAEHVVVDRRRLELIEPGRPAAPVHHHGGTHPMHATGPRLDDATLAALVADARASVARATASALEALAAAVPGPIVSLAVRQWPADFPVDIAVQRRPPHESRADSIMYCQALAAAADARGWAVRTFDARAVEAEAAHRLGSRAEAVLASPRATLGAPWAKDHRLAFAATILG
jgi:hypothetical protein